MHFLSKSEHETIEFAEKFAKKLKGGEVIALSGELGAGKTVFAKGLARGFGIKEQVRSPTFLLMKQYRIKNYESRPQRPTARGLLGGQARIMNFVHIDAYRLNSGKELIDIGVTDWLGRKDTVVVIEWAERVADILGGQKVIKINLKAGEKRGEREIELKNC